MTPNYKLMLQRAAKAVGLPIEWKPDRLRPNDPNAGCFMATYNDPLLGAGTMLTMEFDPVHNIQQAMMLLIAKRYDLKVHPRSVEVFSSPDKLPTKLDKSVYATEMLGVCMAITACVAQVPVLTPKELLVEDRNSLLPADPELVIQQAVSIANGGDAHKANDLLRLWLVQRADGLI